MSSKQFVDNSKECKDKIQNAMLAFLIEASGELESQYKSNSRVDTEKTKDHIFYQINEEKMESYIGGDSENHIWEEYGTGEYAIKGNGRKGGWFYTDSKGKGHFTVGKKPSKAFSRAYDELKPKIIAMAQKKLKGMK